MPGHPEAAEGLARVEGGARGRKARKKAAAAAPDDATPEPKKGFLRRLFGR